MTFGWRQTKASGALSMSQADHITRFTPGSAKSKTCTKKSRGLRSSRKEWKVRRRTWRHNVFIFCRRYGVEAGRFNYKSRMGDCSDYFEKLTTSPDTIGAFDHSWHFADPVFAPNLVDTIAGNVDRTVIPTRENRGGRLFLRRPT
jgi:hypothetical protein